MSRKKYIYSPIIYKTTNLINNLIYVGQHKTSADDGYLGSGSLLKLAIKEFGKENFKREILEHCTSGLDNRERFWIAELHSNDPAIGYNRTVGGQIGWNTGIPLSKNQKLKLSETRIKLGLASGKNNPMYGVSLYGELNGMYKKHHSEETKNKMSQLKTGYKRTEESKKKQSKSNMGKNNPNFGNHKIAGTNHFNNKYIYNLENGKNYWKYFTNKERDSIIHSFKRKQSDNIIYNGIKIQRIKKWLHW